MQKVRYMRMRISSAEAPIPHRKVTVPSFPVAVITVVLPYTKEHIFTENTWKHDFPEYNPSQRPSVKYQLVAFLKRMNKYSSTKKFLWPQILCMVTIISLISTISCTQRFTRIVEEFEIGRAHV